MRSSHLLLILSASLTMAAGPALDAARAGDGPREPLGSAKVSLVLLKASAERRKSDVVFQCEARIDNGTGKDLKVRSNFTSAFDGLELVITDKEGKTLAQWGLTWHQSPFAPPGREFVLKQGSTARTLVFPVWEALAKDTRKVKVRLVGTLPGSAYSRILSTDSIEIDIKQEDVRP